MPPSKLSYSERMRRKREAARLRQQRCRARKRNAVRKKQAETEVMVMNEPSKCSKNEVPPCPDLIAHRPSPDLLGSLVKPKERFLGSEAAYSFRQDLPGLPSRVMGGNLLDAPAPAPHTPVFVPKPTANKPGSTKSAFFSPHSITRLSSPSSQVRRTQRKPGPLIPRPNWNPMPAEFLPPRAPSPIGFRSSRPRVPLSPCIKTAHTFDENEMTAVDAMLSLRYSPVSVTSSPSRVARPIASAHTHADKPFIPVFRHMEAARDIRRERRHFIAEHDLKPGLHMYYN